LSLGGSHCPAIILARVTGIAPLMWPMVNCVSTSTLVSTIMMSALLSIFCNNSSLVIRGTCTEGGGIDVASGGVEGVGAGFIGGVGAVLGSNVGAQLNNANSVNIEVTK